jgi:predicted HTH transcriptional regulator
MTEEDIRHLVLMGAREGPDLEFKVALYPVDSLDSKVRNDARRELFGDLVAMANSGTATLIIGVEEAEGVAIAAPGVDAAQASEFVKKLPELLLRNIEPPLRSVEAEVLPIAGDGTMAFVTLKVRMSADAPHRDSSTRIFYERLGAQRVPMDIDRVRSAFLSGELAYITFDEFRTKRIESLRNRGQVHF